MFSHHPSFSRWGAGIALALFLLPLGITLVPTQTHATASGSVVIVGSDLPRDPREGAYGLPGFDAIAWMLAKMIINEIIMEVKSLIEQGFFGDLMFLVDPQAFIAKLSRDVTNNLIGEISGLDTYEPLKRSMMQLLSVTYTPYSEYAKSTIDDILIEPQAFSEGFFEGGGWSGFLGYTTMPENSYIGQGFMASEENRRLVENKREEIYRELNWGDGILSLPGDCIESAGVDTNGDGFVDAQDGCINWERVNPGQFVANEMSNALGARVQTLENADDIGEILVAILQELVANIINTGFDAARNAVRSGVRNTLTGGGSSSGSGISGGGGSSSQTSAPDQDLIDAIESDLALTDEGTPLLLDIEDSHASAAQAVIIIDNTLADQVLYEEQQINHPSLLSAHELNTLREEANVIADDTAYILDQVDAAGSIDAYVSGLESLLDQAYAAKTSTNIINAWEDYNAFKIAHSDMGVALNTVVTLAESPENVAAVERAHVIHADVQDNYNHFQDILDM
jgi:uncharacterized membrane protein YgcG